MIRKFLPYKPLDGGSYMSMVAGFALVLSVVGLPFVWPPEVAVVAAMIFGPFSGWLLAIICVYLALVPGERRRTEEFQKRQKLRAKHLKRLREERGKSDTR